MKKHLLSLLFIFIFVFALYHPILSIYFSHDDFFNFKVSQTDGTLEGFLNLFGFHPFEERGIAFYRPIFREGLFNSFYSLFGLSYLPFRVLALVIHFINILLVYILMQRLFRRQGVSLFVAFFFGITAGNVGSLYYLTGGIQSLGATMFMLLTLLLFPRKIAFLTFLLGVASHELAVVTPLLLFGLLFTRQQIIKEFKKVAPYFITVAIFLYLDFTLIGFSSNEKQYQVTFSPKAVFNSLGWYSAWAYGVPEMFVDFVGPKFALNPNLMKFWGDYSSGIFFFGTVAFTILAMCVILAFRSTIGDGRFWFLVLWFPIALSPVLLLPLHKQTYYLTPALPAFWGVVGIVVFSAYKRFEKKKKGLVKVFAGAFLVSLIMLSVASATLAELTYPAARRGKIGKKLISDIRAKYPELPKGATVYFQNDPNYPKISGDWGSSSKQAAFVLNGSDALQLLYKDPTLKVVYEDLAEILPEGEIYSLIAKFN